MNRLLIVAVTSTLLVTGCASRPSARGWSPQPDLAPTRTGVGTPFVDFSFYDQTGVQRSLRRELGDYTVLLFTKCESNTHRPANETLRSMLQDVRHGNSNVKIVGVNVHWCEQGCRTKPHCHLVDAEPNLGSICDARGAVRHAYGVEQNDWMIVIGPNRAIELSAPMSRRYEVAAQLKQRAAKLSHGRLAASFTYGDVEW